jgi:hypothetical protein
MRQRRAVPVAGSPIEIEVKSRAGGELDPTFGESPEAELGSLQIGKNPNRSSGRALHPPDRRKPGAVIVTRPMAEVEPEYVDTRLEQGADGLGG